MSLALGQPFHEQKRELHTLGYTQCKVGSSILILDDSWKLGQLVLSKVMLDIYETDRIHISFSHYIVVIHKDIKLDTKICYTPTVRLWESLFISLALDIFRCKIKNLS
jgi:hypothetical protein